VIFVTVGTHHQPFQRLLDALDALDGPELVVQHGCGKPPSQVARAEAYMSFDAMAECFREADAVITHAGVGSILCATREGHVPLVVPRRHDLGEHVDDHQVELARALEGHGNVIAAWNVDALADLLAGLPPRRPRASSGAIASNLSRSVRAALRGEGRPQSSEE
jgi:UDP-N-acetylglucosamine transferase subunit ALG13